MVWNNPFSKSIVIGLLVVSFLIAGCTAEELLRRPGTEVQEETQDGGVVVEKPPETTIEYGEPSNITYGSSTEESTYIYFIDVGYGDSTLIKKGDFDMLIDVGSSETQGERIVSFLNKVGVDDIDILVLTLPFKDHIGGIKPVLKNFKVEEIWDNGVERDTGAYDGYIRYRNKYASDTPIRHPEYGEYYEFNGIEILVLNPLEERMEWGELTHDSITFMISKDNFTVLMTDLEPNLLRERLSEYYGGEYNVPKVNMLKLAQHGDSVLEPPIENMEYRRIIRMVRPDYAVILVGPNNLGKPDPSVLGAFEANSIPILRTDYNGTIVVKHNSTGYYIETVA